jgi:hypothetical protein
MINENIVITSNSRDNPTRLQERKKEEHNFRNLNSFHDVFASRISCGIPRTFDPAVLIFRTLPLIAAPALADAVTCETLKGPPGEDDIFGCPGTKPESVLLAISARMAPIHLISSSSLGAHSKRVRFVVTILNV